MDELAFRRARICDAAQIHALVNRFARDDLMLPRALAEIYETIRDFHVCVHDGRVVGCCAMHVSWEGLGEVRSLAVEQAYRHRGVGRRLVSACASDAAEIGLDRLFVLTYIAGFFTGMGFAPIPKEQLPHKVWADCTRCPKFPNCDEEALIRPVVLVEGDP